jgi:hypothetical protein
MEIERMEEDKGKENLEFYKDGIRVEKGVGMFCGGNEVVDPCPYPECSINVRSRNSEGLLHALKVCEGLSVDPGYSEAMLEYSVLGEPKQFKIPFQSMIPLSKFESRIEKCVRIAHRSRGPVDSYPRSYIDVRSGDIEDLLHCFKMNNGLEFDFGDSGAKFYYDLISEREENGWYEEQRDYGDGDLR